MAENGESIVAKGPSEPASKSLKVTITDVQFAKPFSYFLSVQLTTVVKRTEVSEPSNSPVFTRNSFEFETKNDVHRLEVKSFIVLEGGNVVKQLGEAIVEFSARQPVHLPTKLTRNGNVVTKLMIHASIEANQSVVDSGINLDQFSDYITVWEPNKQQRCRIDVRWINKLDSQVSDVSALLKPSNDNLSKSLRSNSQVLFQMTSEQSSDCFVQFEVKTVQKEISCFRYSISDKNCQHLKLVLGSLCEIYCSIALEKKSNKLVAVKLTPLSNNSQKEEIFSFCLYTQLPISFSEIVLTDSDSKVCDQGTTQLNGPSFATLFMKPNSFFSKLVVPVSLLEEPIKVVAYQWNTNKSFETGYLIAGQAINFKNQKLQETTLNFSDLKLKCKLEFTKLFFEGSIDTNELETTVQTNGTGNELVDVLVSELRLKGDVLKELLREHSRNTATFQQSKVQLEQLSHKRDLLVAENETLRKELQVGEEMGEGLLKPSELQKLETVDLKAKLRKMAEIFEVEKLRNSELKKSIEVIEGKLRQSESLRAERDLLEESLKQKNKELVRLQEEARPVDGLEDKLRQQRSVISKLESSIEAAIERDNAVGQKVTNLIDLKSKREKLMAAIEETMSFPEVSDLEAKRDALLKAISAKAIGGETAVARRLRLEIQLREARQKVSELERNL